MQVSGRAGRARVSGFFERLLGGSYPGLDDYWRTASYGAINLAGSTMVGWYSMPHGSDVYRIGQCDVHTDDSVVTADLQRLAEDCTAAVDRPIDWAHFFGINLVINADLDRPREGQMCLVRGGVDKCYGATWIWASKATDQALWAHEMGHSFGLRHSSLGLGATNDNLAARFAYDRVMEAVRPAMEQPEWAEAWARGRAMSLADAVAFALDENV